MHLPAIIFGLVLCIIYGTLFHAIMGGGFGRLVLFCVAATLGFWGGQMIGDHLHWSLINIGLIHIDLASIGAMGFLFIAHWLSKAEPASKRV